MRHVVYFIGRIATSREHHALRQHHGAAMPWRTATLRRIGTARRTPRVSVSQWRKVVLAVVLCSICANLWPWQHRATAAPLSGKAWTQLIVGGAAALYFGIKLNSDLRKVHGSVNQAEALFDGGATQSAPADDSLRATRERVIQAVLLGATRKAGSQSAVLPKGARTLFEDYRVCWNSIVSVQPAPASTQQQPTAKTKSDPAGSPSDQKPPAAKPGSNMTLYSASRSAADADVPATPSCDSLLKDFVKDQTKSQTAALIIDRKALSDAGDLLTESKSNASKAMDVLQSAPLANVSKVNMTQLQNRAEESRHAVDSASKRVAELAAKVDDDKSEIAANAFPKVLSDLDQTDLASALKNAPSIAQQIVAERVGSYAEQNELRGVFLITLATNIIAQINPPSPAFRDRSRSTSGPSTTDISSAVKSCYTSFSPIDCLTGLNTVEQDIVSGESQAAGCAWAANAFIPTFTGIMHSETAKNNPLSGSNLGAINSYRFGASDGC